MGSSFELTVVVGTHDRRDQIQRCVESIRAQARVSTKIVVTDAGSTDGTIEYLSSAQGADLEAIFVGRRIGQAKAYNDVFRAVTSPYVAWLSDDNEVVDHGLDRAVEAMQRDARIGMVGLKVRDLLGPFTKAPYIGGVSKTGVLNVNQGVLPTSVLRDVGYFSEAFGFYGIDPDLTAKVLYAGRHVVYTRGVAIHHYRNWPADRGSPEYAALQRHHDHAARLYDAKYGAVARGDALFWARRAAWKAIREAMGPRFSINGQVALWGALPRDWHNAFAARHINPLELFYDQKSPVYLRQSVSPLGRPRDLPDDLAAVALTKSGA